MKIYTKFGDKGNTKLISGETVSKNDKLIIAYGNIDKLISFLGFIITFYKEFYISTLKKKYKMKSKTKKELDLIFELLNDIQILLFDVSTDLASTNLNQEQKNKIKIKQITQEDILKIEEIIDKIWSKIGNINSFVIPSNNTLSAMLHYLRTLTRETESKVVECSQQYQINPNILPLINRLSDLFFTISLYLEILINNDIKLLVNFRSKRLFENFFKFFK
mgnify:CR=1 FL=1